MKIYKISQKRDRDSNQYKLLYHISPEKITSLRALSSFRGHKGLYFSPSYTSLIEDWMPFVISKKGDNKYHEKQIDRLQDHIRRLEKRKKDSSKKTIEEIDLEIQKLEDKITEMYHKKNQKKDNSDKEETNSSYKTLFVHEVYCPKKVYNASKQWFFSFAKGDIENFGFWGWGQQVFIPEQFLSMLNINNVKKLNRGELSDEMFNVSRRDNKSKGWWDMVNKEFNPKK